MCRPGEQRDRGAHDDQQLQVDGRAHRHAEQRAGKDLDEAYHHGDRKAAQRATQKAREQHGQENQHVDSRIGIKQFRRDDCE